jgi:hypothetical protein
MNTMLHAAETPNRIRVSRSGSSPLGGGERSLGARDGT